MRNFITLLLSIFTSCALAQNPIFIEPDKQDADNLKRIFQNPLNDTLEMAACLGLALYYLDIKIDSSKFFSARALQLSEKLKLMLWEVNALDLNAIALNRSSDYSQSLEVYMKAISIGSDLKSEQEIWRIAAFTLSGNPGFARKNMLATVYFDLGTLYSATNFHEKAFTSFRKSLSLAAEIGDYTVPVIIYEGMAKSYISLNRLDSAKIALQKALAYGDSAAFYKYRGDAYTKLGTIALLLGNIDEAKDHFYKALKWSIDQNNVVNEAETYTAFSRLYYSEGNLDSSYFYAKKGLAVSQNTAFKENILQSDEQLYKIHKALNQQDSAFFYLENIKILSDSINTEEKIKQFQNIGFEEQLKIRELQNAREKLNNRIKTNTLLGSTFTLIIIAFFLYRNNRNKQKAKRKIEISYDKLKSTQAQLIQSEKMASLGELTAGIAHEIQNPLNFVNNFSELNKEMIAEMKEEIDKGNYDEVKIIADDIEANEEKITHHGKRADAIVKGMLQHSQSSTGKKETTDINALCDEYLRLSYHGLRAKDKLFNTTLQTNFDESIDLLNIIPQDIGRVLLNLYNNAFYACGERCRSEKELVGLETYVPTVTLVTKKLDDKVLISVKDNGNGIPQKIVDKIFQPFFTTKPTGQGTGLGLSLSYDIIKAHGGEIKVETKEGEGSEFIIQLPAV